MTPNIVGSEDEREVLESFLREERTDPYARGGIESMMHGLHVGCSGWNYDHWRDGVFYPPRCPARSWLSFYAERFDTVEVNSTFYRLPRRDAVARWVEQTPVGFVFAVKVSRYVTHVKRLRDVDVHLPLLLERIAPLAEAGRLGPLLWQLPPTFARDDGLLEEALAAFPRDLRHAVEFRHDSWFAAKPLALLAKHGVALVVADRPGAPGPDRLEPTAGFSFVRFHHGARGRRGNYSKTELADWAGTLRLWASRGAVYAYFNNDWEGFAPRNAMIMREHLR
jgi:uncharacterized protein YecE (DUF72 family)